MSLGLSFGVILMGAIPLVIILLIPALLLRFLVFRKTSPPKSFLYSIALPVPVLSYLPSAASGRGFSAHFVEYLIAAIILGLLYLALYFTVFSKNIKNKQKSEIK